MSWVGLFSSRLQRYYFAFFVIGFFTVMAGPLLPWFAERFRLLPSQTGTLFFAQFTASTLGAVLSGFNSRLASRGGVALIGLAVLAIAIGDWPMIIAGFALGGLGFGLAIPVINMAVANEDGGGPRAVSLLNAFWGIGAFMAPLVLEGTLAKKMAMLTVAALALLATAMLPKPGLPLFRPQGKGGFQLLPFVTFSCMMFLYIGTESTAGGWIPSLAAASLSTRIPAASAFWGALVIGRLLAPSVLTRWSARSVIFAGLAIAGSALFGLWKMPLLPLWLPAMVAGLGLAPVFPTMLPLFLNRIPVQALGICFATGGMGGATLPWLSGYVATISGHVRDAFTIALMATLVLFILIFVSSRNPLVKPELTDNSG